MGLQREYSFDGLFANKQLVLAETYSIQNYTYSKVL